MIYVWHGENKNREGPVARILPSAARRGHIGRKSHNNQQTIMLHSSLIYVTNKAYVNQQLSVRADSIHTLCRWQK